MVIYLILEFLQDILTLDRHVIQQNLKGLIDFDRFEMRMTDL